MTTSEGPVTGIEEDVDRLAVVQERIDDARQAADEVADAENTADDDRRAAADAVTEGDEVAPG